MVFGPRGSTNRFLCSYLEIFFDLFNASGANSLVTDEVAIVVDKGSDDALVDGIKKMIEKLPAFSADTIYNYAFKNFEIGEVSLQYMKLYNDLLENK